MEVDSREQEEHGEATGDAFESDQLPGSGGRTGFRLAKNVEEYSNTSLVRRQHRMNLLSVMRQAMLTSDYHTAAGVIATLMACMSHKMLAQVPGPHYHSQEPRDSMLELLWNTLELLRQHDTPPEQLRRCLSKLMPLLTAVPTMRQVTKLELILSYWTKDPSDIRTGLQMIKDEVALKVMQGRSFESVVNFTFHLHAIEGYIKHGRWIDQALNSSASSRLLGSQVGSQFSSQASILSSKQSSSSTQVDISQELLGPLQLGPFAPREDLILSLNDASEGQTQPSQGFTQLSQGFTQQSQVYSQGGEDDSLEPAKRALATALQNHPAALIPAVLLSHTLMLMGGQEQATEVAQSAVNASGRSTEALSLLAVILEQAATEAAEAGSADDQLPAVGTEASQHPAGAVRDRQAVVSDSQYHAVADEEPVMEDSGADDAVLGDPVHDYVDLCLEILQSDPLQPGAVQGLMDMAGHCQQCAAAAIRGLLAHLDAVAVGCTASLEDAQATSNSAWSAETNQAVVWSFLSVLLVQLASDVIADAAQQATAAAQQQQIVQQAAAARQQPATHPSSAPRQQPAPPQAASTDAQQDPVNTDNQAPATTSQAVAAAAAPPGPTAAQLVWEGLQESFAERQSWWSLPGGPADTGELQYLWSQQQLLQGQEQQQRDEHRDLQGQQTQGVEDVDGSQGGQQQPQQQPRERKRASRSQADADELVLLMGSGSDLDPDESEEFEQSGGTSHGTTADATRAAGHDDALSPEQSAAMSWSDVQQVLCCKAVALVFVLGPRNAYSRAAADVLAEAAAAGAAEEVGASVHGTSDEDLEESSALSTSAARAALEDACQLWQQTNQWLELRRQQKLQQLVDQQLQQQGSRCLLGPPSDMFGGVLDLPGSWWACFPHKRRRRQQQQQSPAVQNTAI